MSTRVHDQSGPGLKQTDAPLTRRNGETARAIEGEENMGRSSEGDSRREGATSRRPTLQLAGGGRLSGLGLTLGTPSEEVPGPLH